MLLRRPHCLPVSWVFELIALLLLAMPVHAQDSSDTDKEQARRLMALGDERFAKGDYQGALDAYRGAELVVAVPTTTLQVARALVALHKLVEARAALKRILLESAPPDEPPAFASARGQAKRLDADLQRRAPTLAVELKGVPRGARAWVSVNGVTWPERIRAKTMNPGSYRIEVAVDGKRVHERSVRLDEGDREVLHLEIPSAPADKHDTSISPLVYVGFGVAGAGVIVGTVTGVLSLVRAGEVKDACFSDDVCPQSVQPIQQESLTLAHVSTASFATAGAGAIVGLIALFGSFGAPSSGTRIAIDSFGLNGNF